MFAVGDRALDFTLETAAGEQVSLSGALGQGRLVLIVFLRHFG